MDEPFGAIDPVTRVRLQDEFLRLQREVQKTVVFVTHDIDEAVKMGDRIAILDVGGVLEQYATPAEILGRPASNMVRDFVGHDRALKRLRVTPDRARVPRAPADGAARRDAGRRPRRDREVGRRRGSRSSAATACSAATSTARRRRARARSPTACSGSRRGCPVDHDLQDVLATMLLTREGWVSVLDGDRFVGVLTPEAVYQTLRRSLEQPPDQKPDQTSDQRPGRRPVTSGRERADASDGERMAMDVADSLLDLVGNTPLVRLGRVGRDLECDLLAKVELFNPGGSVKDRPAVAMIDAAERDGLLRPGGTIVEPTSGNTGAGLAIVAAQRGYRCIFVMADKMSEEKISLLRAYGADVVVCPTAVAPEDPASYYSVADRLTRETPGAFRPDQYSNPANPAEHERSTGPEIWRQTDGRVTHFVAGVGTGGTITGVARYLKAQNPDVQIVAADPAGLGVLGRQRSPVPGRGRGRRLLAHHLRPVARRPHRGGQRRRVVRGRPARHARRGPADRRLVRHRGARGAGRRRRARSRRGGRGAPARLRAATTCRRSSTTAG